MRSLLLRLVFFLVRSLRPATVAPPRTILILQDKLPLGCCVHGTPLYAALKAAHPSAQLLVATRGLGLQVLQHDPHVDRLLDTVESTAAQPLRQAARLRRQLRGLRLAPDLLLQDASNRAGSYALLALSLRLAPAAGFANAAPLYDTHLSYDPTLSLIDNNLRLLTVLGAQPRPTEPAVYFTAADLAHARTLLGEPPRPTVAFVLQGSGDQPTHWRDERFAAVLRHVASRGHRILYLGTAAEAPTIDRIRALAGNLGTSFAGRTTIPQLAAVLCLCDLLVSVDTGTLHVGRAANLPLVVLGPSWQPPLEWLPVARPNARVLRGADTQAIPPLYQLDEITPGAVIAAIDDLITLYPPSPKSREARTQRLLSTTRA